MDWNVAAVYIKGAVFEASSDGVTYTALGVVDETVHAGWNSILVETAANYRYVRMRHDSASECKLAEFEAFGVTLSDASVPDLTSHFIDAEITDGLNSYTLANAVEYRQDKTPLITGISQERGSVHGGDTLTLTGNYLDIGEAMIEVDGIECVVEVSATTATSLQCVTGCRQDLPERSSFTVGVAGNVAVV